MMGPTVDPFNDCVRCPFQLVLKTAFDQPSDDGGRGFLAVQSEAAHIPVAASAANSSVHGLDDVAAGVQIAQS